MASANLSADLSLDRLQPAASVREAEAQASPHDAERKSRRRAPAEDETVEAVEETGEPEHQVDSLA